MIPFSRQEMKSCLLVSSYLEQSPETNIYIDMVLFLASYHVLIPQTPTMYICPALMSLLASS